MFIKEVSDNFESSINKFLWHMWVTNDSNSAYKYNFMSILGCFWGICDSQLSQNVFLVIVWTRYINSMTINGSYFNQCDPFESLLNDFWHISRYGIFQSLVNSDSFLSHMEVSQVSYNVYMLAALNNLNDSLWFYSI